MSNVVIYYKMADEQQSEEVIKEIKMVINNIDQNVVGVFIDSHNHTDEFSNLIRSDLSAIKTLYINKALVHDFDKQIINELARNEGFSIVYFPEIEKDRRT